jgi:hypothetical protein
MSMEAGGMDWEEDGGSTSPVEGLDDSPVADGPDSPSGDVDFVTDELMDGPGPAELGAEVEGRIQLIQCYNVLLGNGYLFEERSRAADHVNSEVQGFIRGRLMEMLGMQGGKSAVPSPQFSDEDATTLREFAALWRLKSTSKPGGAGSPPQIKRAGAPQPDTMPAPAVVAPQPPPAAPLRPAPAVAPTMARPPPKVSPLLLGRQHKKVVIEASPERDQHLLARLPEKYRDDPTLRVQNGRASVQLRNGEGEPMWEKKGGKMVALRREVTPPSVPAPSSGLRPLPTPSPEMAEAIGMQQASQLSQRVASSEVLGGALVQSIQGQ